MTCIASIIDKNGDIYMGSDSAGTAANFSQCLRADEKIFINGEFIFGIAGSFRMGQLLRYEFEPPKFYGDVDLYKYMVKIFIKEVRECLKDGGFANKKDEVERIEGQFLVGFKGNLFIIEGDYQVGKSMDNFDSVGSGESIALGSLYSTKDLQITATDRLMLALESAERFNAGVRRPFVIIKLDKTV